MWSSSGGGWVACAPPGPSGLSLSFVFFWLSGQHGPWSSLYLGALNGGIGSPCLPPLPSPTPCWVSSEFPPSRPCFEEWLKLPTCGMKSRVHGGPLDPCSGHLAFSLPSQWLSQLRRCLSLAPFHSPGLCLGPGQSLCPPPGNL